jgi:membrane-associated phospholipid phosphatase
MVTDKKQETAQETVNQAIAPKRTRNYRALAFQGYVIAAAVAFGVLFALVWNVPYFTIDLTVTRAIQTISWPWFAVFMEIISFPGIAPYSFALVLLIIVVLFAVGLRWESVSSLIAGAGGSIADTVAKAIVHRARPAADIVHVVQTVSGYSFPSGHVVFYTAFFGFLIFLAYSLLKERVVWRSTLIFVFSFLVATIGISRIYLGAHWFSDVLGAYLLGSLWLALTIYVYRWGKPRFFTRQPAAPEPQTAVKVETVASPAAKRPR